MRNKYSRCSEHKKINIELCLSSVYIEFCANFLNIFADMQQIKLKQDAKNFDDKWLVTLKSQDDLSKRYKALLSIRKFFKEEKDDLKYRQVMNENCKYIFQVTTEKFARYFLPSQSINLIGSLH